MAKKASPWRGIVKWVVVPAALAGIGYAFVGPRIGGPLAEKAAEQLKSAPLPAEVASLVRRKAVSEPTASTEPTKLDREPAPKTTVPDDPAPVAPAAEPQIEVKVRRADSVLPVTSPRRSLRAESPSGTYPDLTDPSATEPPKRKKRRSRKPTAEKPKPPESAPVTDPASTPFPETVPPIDPASGPGNGSGNGSGTETGGDPAGGGTTGL